jgi:hypothetical protein
MTTRAQVSAGSDGEKALQEALAVTPSPEFAARVRERVRKEAPRAAAGWWPRVAFAGAVVAAVMIAAALWNGRTGPERAAVAGRTMTRTPAAAAVETRRPEPAPTPSPMPEDPASRSIATRAVTLPLIITRAPVHEDPREVLVPDDERRALDRFLIAIREGRAAVPAPRRVLEDEYGRLLEPRPIEIPVLKPIEPLPGTAADRSGSKDK